MACHMSLPMKEISPWAIQGNIVIVTGDPFGSDQRPSRSETSFYLGAGISILRDHILAVDDNGFISKLAPVKTLPEDILRYYRRSPYFISLGEHEFLCPGFIDLHIHAPQ
jgi:cytosine/adenosine deaminase-related metal-dependent hydrolase